MRLYLINWAKVWQEHALRPKRKNAIQTGVPVFETQVRRRRWWTDQRWIFQSYTRNVTGKEIAQTFIKERDVMNRVSRRIEYPQFAWADGDLIAIIHDVQPLLWHGDDLPPERAHPLAINACCAAHQPCGID